MSIRSEPRWMTLKQGGYLVFPGRHLNNRIGYFVAGRPWYDFGVKAAKSDGGGIENSAYPCISIFEAVRILGSGKVH